jgi:hypothetical protein
MTPPSPPHSLAPRLLILVVIAALSAAGFASVRALPASGASAAAFASPTVALPNPALSASGLFYVSPTGSDTNTGTHTSPWRTIQKAVNTLSAGQTVVVRGGTYPEFVVAERGGVALIGAPGEWPKITGRLKIRAQAFRVSGFVFEGGSDVGVWVDGASDVEVSLNEIRGSAKSCLFGGGNRVRIVSNWLHHCGRSVINQNPQDHGIYWAGGSDSLIANNVITDNLGFGVQMYPYSTSARNVIRNNTILNNGLLVGDSRGASGIVLDQGYTSDNLVENNVLGWHSECGVRGQSDLGPRNIVRGNVGWQNTKGDFPTGLYGYGLTYGSNTVADPFASTTMVAGSSLLRSGATAPPSTTTTGTTSGTTTTTPAPEPTKEKSNNGGRGKPK